MVLICIEIYVQYGSSKIKYQENLLIYLSVKNINAHQKLQKINKYKILLKK